MKLIKIGETTIQFSNLERNSFDNSMNISISRKNCSLSGRFFFFSENTPMDKILSLESYPDIAWKSDCENLVITKKIDKDQSVFNVNFCIDSQELDEYWEINIVSAPEARIEIDSEKIKHEFREST